MKTEWDYSQRAATYDKRADYSDQAIDDLLVKMEVSPEQPVADVGAGTGKLSLPLLQRGLKVFSVEPNANMRALGVQNTQGKDIVWSVGVGENTGLPDSSVQSVFFGSSFNVVDQAKTLIEVARILKPGGYFACMWNHRDLDDPVQKQIEDMIARSIPDYQYGTRRQDPTHVINESGLFGEVGFIEGTFRADMATVDIVDAWKSHDTLYRQAGSQFNHIIAEIESFLTEERYGVPYTTRIWYAKYTAA